MKIESKRAMYDLFFEGKLGNRLRNYHGIEDMWDDGYAGLVGMRYIGPRGGKEFIPYVRAEDAFDRATDLLERKGLDPYCWIYSEMAPDEHILFQGEVLRSDTGWYLRYTTVPKPMRTAFVEEELHLHGAAAFFKLKSAMDTASWENLMHLFDDYPDAIVEFSIYDRPLGIDGWNTLTWEVRNY